MSFIEKLTEYLLKKQWVIFCLSILVGFGGYYLLPSDFVDKMPFSSRDWNVIACIVLLSIVAYLFFSLVRFMFSKIRVKRRKNKDKRYMEKKCEEQDRAKIEEIKSGVDRWSDRDYSIVMYLLENGNKKPYIQWGHSFGESIIDMHDLFNRAPYHGQKVITFETSDGPQSATVMDPAYQYLLKPEIYELLKYIQEETGSIAHFEKHRVDIDQ
ncbi:MAG: hypothetical protein IJJ60_00990 [Clostridia bacterium]|nr:hypothetical protein [Clostridia bacterium]